MVVFPDIVITPNQADTTVRKQLGLPQKNESIKEPNPLYTYVIFNGDRFDAKVITMHRGSYLSIVNNSPDKLMWLISKKVSFTTTRGYGKSEQAVSRLDVPETFTITEKDNPNARLTINVK